MHLNNFLNQYSVKNQKPEQDLQGKDTNSPTMMLTDFQPHAHHNHSMVATSTSTTGSGSGSSSNQSSHQDSSDPSGQASNAIQNQLVVSQL